MIKNKTAQTAEKLPAALWGVFGCVLAGIGLNLAVLSEVSTPLAVSCLAVQVFGAVCCIVLMIRKQTGAGPASGSNRDADVFQVLTPPSVLSLAEMLRQQVEYLLVHNAGSTCSAAFSLDDSGRVTGAEGAVQILFGRSAKELEGRPCSEILEEVNISVSVRDLIEEALHNQEVIEATTSLCISSDKRDVTGRVATRLEPGVPPGVVVAVDSGLFAEQLHERFEKMMHLAAAGSLAAQVAHDLKSPVASLSGLVEILREHVDGGDSSPVYAEMEKSCERITLMLQNLLDFASMQECVFTVQPAEYSVLEAVTERRYRAEAEGKKLIARFSEEKLRINANTRWLARAVGNLIDNALDATPAGGEVTVTLKAAQNEPGKLDIAVHNSGSHIPAAEIKTLFTAYKSNKHGGHGLGLVIVNGVARMHGGTVQVQSSQESGTLFEMSLPVLVNDPRKKSHAAGGAACGNGLRS